MQAFRLREYLKRETREFHERVDRAFSRFSLSEDSGVERFLAAQAGALRPLERALDTSCGERLETLLPDWPARRRAHLLKRLQVGVPGLHVEPFRTTAEMLGAAYVLEGSRLGARLLLRQIRERESQVGRLAVSFLSHDPGAQHWHSFVTVLDRFGGESSCSESRSAALGAFALFERSAASVYDPFSGHPERNAAGSRRPSGNRNRVGGSAGGGGNRPHGNLADPKSGEIRGTN